jgi:hypothetical protein
MFVHTYSDLKLSLPSDRLPAISAVTETFGATLSNASTTHQSHKAGLWVQHFPFNLLWFPRQRDITKPQVYRAPSFSWVSVDCAVSYDPCAWYAIPLEQIPVRSMTCETKLASLEAPFGQVIGGHLEIEAPLTEQTVSNNPGRILLDMLNGIRAKFPLTPYRSRPI